MGRYDVKGHIPFVYDNWMPTKYTLATATWDFSVTTVPYGPAHAATTLTTRQVLKYNLQRAWGATGSSLVFETLTRHS